MEVLSIMRWAILLCLIGINAFAFLITVYDKIAARSFPHNRVPEIVLLGVSAIGGSVAMLLTMLLIRHKTKHPKFMVGIPIIIILQIAVVLFVTYVLGIPFRGLFG